MAVIMWSFYTLVMSMMFPKSFFFFLNSNYRYCYHPCHTYLEILLSFCATGQKKLFLFPLLNVTGLGSVLTATGPLDSNVKWWSEAAPCELYNAFHLLMFSDIWISQVFRFYLFSGNDGLHSYSRWNTVLVEFLFACQTTARNSLMLLVKHYFHWKLW